MFWLFVVGLLALVPSPIWIKHIAKVVVNREVAKLLPKKLKEKDTFIATLQMEVVRSKQQLTDTNFKLIDANLKLAEANMTSQRLTTLIQYFKEAVADSVKLEKLMAEKSIAKKRQSLKASEQCVKALEQSNASLSAENLKLLGSMASKEFALDASRSIRNVLAKSNADLATKVATLTSDNTTLRNRVASLDGDAWDLHNRVQYKAKELRDMTVQLEERAQNNADMREYISELQQTIDEKDETLKTYKQNMTVTTHALQGQIEDLTTKSEAYKNEITALRYVSPSTLCKSSSTPGGFGTGQDFPALLQVYLKPVIHPSIIANAYSTNRACHIDVHRQLLQTSRDRDNAKDACDKITAKVNNDISMALGKFERAQGDIEHVRNENKALKEENEDLALEVQQLVEHLESRVPDERTGYGYVSTRGFESDCAIKDESSSESNPWDEFDEEIRILGDMTLADYGYEYDDADETASESDSWHEYGEGYDAEDEEADPWEAYEESATVIGDWEGYEKAEDVNDLIDETAVDADPWAEYNELSTRIGSWEDDDTVFLSDIDGFEHLEVIDGVEVDSMEYEAVPRK
jgi:hypothetical protein